MSRRLAFYVDEAFMTRDGIVPALVTEGEPGYGLMLGNGPYSSPWYWGMDIETAQKVCDKANADRGLTPEEARAIVDSSIAAQNRQDTLRAEFEARWAEMKEERL